MDERGTKLRRSGALLDPLNASVDETQYYYHHVVSAFAIVKQRDRVADTVIPEVMAYED